MVAEVQLYWIIYNRCSLAKNDLVDTKLALEAWQREWMRLFNEPRSQFLQMGFHFAHLLAYCQSLKSPKSVMHSSILKEIVRHSRGIINLAIDTTDERTRHLTDHIYHILSFSALTLCRIVQTYEPNLRVASYEIAELDNLVFELINWLKSIGPSCHAAHILGEIVLTQFRKIRPNFFPTPSMVPNSLTDDTGGIFTDGELSLPADPSLMYSNFVGWEMFDMDAEESLWPEWARSDSDTDRPM
ncbi:unnamed protein product [Clonostachys rhizophaga]|uniref:Uncharacterized protein n=1 Tax=Clonostachys rhizophaga TaxID=160324 RepID=A0A9N9VXM2_9HYPO|nr:unnamed protein product [Clonostachys rhizophaga]